MKRMIRLPLVTYADARNLCWKRRQQEEVKMAETPSPKWEGSGTGLFNLSLSLSRSLSGVEQAAKGHRVFYGGTGELLHGIIP